MSRNIVLSKLGRCRLCIILSYSFTIVGAISTIASLTYNPHLFLLPSSFSMGFFASFSIAHTAAYIHQRIRQQRTTITRTL